MVIEFDLLNVIKMRIALIGNNLKTNYQIRVLKYTPTEIGKNSFLT